MFLCTASCIYICVQIDEHTYVCKEIDTSCLGWVLAQASMAEVQVIRFGVTSALCISCRTHSVVDRKLKRLALRGILQQRSNQVRLGTTGEGL